MSYINTIIVESLNAPVKQFVHDAKHDPNKAASTVINLGSLAAALYHIYANSKDKDDKISAAINSLPAAAMKGLAVALAGHTLKDIARGNYSYDPERNPLYAKTPGIKYDPHYNNHMNNHHNQHYRNHR